MNSPRSVLLAAVLLGLVAVPASVTASGTASSCAIPDGTVVSITTDDPGATSAGVEVSGRARVTDVYEFTGWFEYRVAGSGDWRATNRTTVETNACGQGWFESTLSGLARSVTYEYRAVVSTPNDTARGNVSTFSTGPDGRLVTTTGVDTATRPTTPTETDATPTRTATPTATPAPCPNYRGAMALCTTTPTPPDPDTPTADSDVGTTTPNADRPAGAWLDGLLPVVTWLGAVVVLAPLVLGAMVGLDWLRRGGK